MRNLRGGSPLLLVGDHAGRVIPSGLGDLGLGRVDRARHIAWDIGVAGLGLALSKELDAGFIRQRYSRLVIDCNRKPGAEGSIAAVSDGSEVPGNSGLVPEDQAARRREVFEPYQGRIAAELDLRLAQGRPTVLVAVHSFTPSMGGFARPWRYGVLHRGDSAFSAAVMAGLRRRMGEAAGDNQPYDMNEIDFTVPFHADPRGLDYLELEVRQDLIALPEQQLAVAAEVAEVLREAIPAARSRLIP